MRINYLCWIPGDNFGGCERYALRVVERARELGWNVTVICMHKRCADEFRKRCPKVNVVESPPVQLPILFRGKPFYFRGKGKIECVIQWLFYIKSVVLYRPDVAHLVLPWHTYGTHVVEIFTWLRVPILVTFQLVGVGEKPNTADVRVFQSAVRHGSRLCAISKNNKKLLCNYYGISSNDVAVVHNRPGPIRTVQLSQEQRNRVRLGIGVEDDANMILTIGGLRKQKGYDFLVRGIVGIIQGFPKTVFVWAGDGEWKEYLSDLASAHKIQHKIRMLGQREDVAQLLSAADLFLFPTRFEGGESFAVCEAASAGLPIVASSASGIPELLRDGLDAYLFPVGDVDTMVKSVIEALSDPEEAARRAESAKSRVSAYTENNMLNDTFKLLENIASRIR